MVLYGIHATVDGQWPSGADRRTAFYIPFLLACLFLVSGGRFPDGNGLGSIFGTSVLFRICEGKADTGGANGALCLVPASGRFVLFCSLLLFMAGQRADFGLLGHAFMDGNRRSAYLDPGQVFLSEYAGWLFLLSKRYSIFNSGRVFHKNLPAYAGQKGAP